MTFENNLMLPLARFEMRAAYFLQNVSSHLPGYTVSQTRTLQHKIFTASMLCCLKVIQVY